MRLNFKKKLLFLAAFLLLSVLLTACAPRDNKAGLKTEQERGKNISSEEKDNLREEKDNSGNKGKDIWDDILSKMIEDKDLSAEEKAEYEKNGNEILELIFKAGALSDECLREGKKHDSTFSDIHLGKNSAFYADPGIDGFLKNFKLLTAVKTYQKCILNNGKEIRKVLVDKYVAEALLSQYNLNKILFFQKEQDPSLCQSDKLSSEAKKYCLKLDEDFVVDSAKQAYRFSKKEISKKKIKQEIKSFIATTNIIQSLE